MPTDTFLNLPKAKQDKVLNAAIDIIKEKGYDKTSISDIVKKASIPRGSFYQYFKDKFDLYYYLFDLIQTKKMAYFKSIVAKFEDRSFVDLYDEIVMAGLKFAQENEDAFMLGYHLYKASDATVQKLWLNMEQRGIEAYEAFLWQDQKKGFISKDINVTVVAKMLYHFNAVELLKMIYNKESEAKIRALTHETIEVIKYGVLKNEVKR